MARGVNWSRIASRNRMRRQRVEDRKDKPPVIEPSKKPRRKLSKAELRGRTARGATQLLRAGKAEEPSAVVVEGLAQR